MLHFSGIKSDDWSPTARNALETHKGVGIFVEFLDNIYDTNRLTADENQKKEKPSPDCLG